MNSENEIINRVSASSLVTFNLEDYYVPGERVALDIRDQLFQEVLLREKDFRQFIKTHDWERYDKKFVAVGCSADAIVPAWAYMLLGIALQPFASRIVYGSLRDLETILFREALSTVDWNSFSGQKVVVKGCSKVEVPETIYLEVAVRLKPVVASLMFGEPCSTVPLFKKRPG